MVSSACAFTHRSLSVLMFGLLCTGGLPGRRTSPVKGPYFDTLVPEGRYVLFPDLVPNLRVLTGFEMMQLIGVPSSILDKFILAPLSNLDVASNDGLCHHLAGNAFSGGVIVALFVSILLHVEPQCFTGAGSSSSGSMLIALSCNAAARMHSFYIVGACRLCNMCDALPCFRWYHLTHLRLSLATFWPVMSHAGEAMLKSSTWRS
jgi:hypothetical protein